MFADTTPTNHPSAADGMPPHAETTGKAPWAWTWILFVASQVLLLAAGGVWAGYQWRQDQARYALPRFPKEPRRVGPLHDRPNDISDAELSRLLWKLRPRFRQPKSQVNHVDHALRFWGVEAKFADEDCLSGEEMRALLLDYRRFKSNWGDETEPFLNQTSTHGVRARVAEGVATASHVDHTLATLAEVGTPLDYPIVLDDGEAKVWDLLRQAVRDFSLNQVEYEWSVLAFALYTPSRTEWFTSEKQRISFDRLAQRIMRQDLPQGVCYGNHRLYTLAVLLRLQDETPLLSAGVQAEVTQFLTEMTARLVKNQKADGSWDRDWAGPLPAGASDGPGSNPLGNRILATGHALEWWAIAPKSLHPPEETLQRGLRWLVTTIDKLDRRGVDTNYTFLTHAGRALAFWRKRWPAEVTLTPVEESLIEEPPLDPSEPSTEAPVAPADTSTEAATTAEPAPAEPVAPGAEPPGDRAE